MLKSLKILHLEDNAIEYIDKDVFKLMPEIKHLYLSGNQLRSLEFLGKHNKNCEGVIMSFLSVKVIKSNT